MALAVDNTPALTARQRLLVAAAALVVLALTALRPTPEVLGAEDEPSRPFVAEEPSLDAGR